MCSGWDQLNCPYFFEVASRTLGDYFLANGFTLSKTKIGGLLFTRWGTYVEISYIPESCPNYAVTVVVGLGDATYDESGAPTGVPAWYVVPGDSPARKYSLWGFSSENKLENVLKRVQVEVIQPFMEPLWTRTEVLEKMIDRFRKEAPWNK